MGSLHAGDEELHYSDSAHRWIPPREDIDIEVWRQRVHDHLEEHRRPPDRGPRRPPDRPPTREP
jgi:hypothetical protein